jgi:hypothetical protein
MNVGDTVETVTVHDNGFRQPGKAVVADIVGDKIIVEDKTGDLLEGKVITFKGKPVVEIAFG